jgi:hypothetical protein
MIRRARLFIRAWTAGRNGSTPKAAVFGICETEGEDPVEMVRGYVLSGTASGGMLVPTGQVLIPCCDIADHDAGSIMTSLDWPRPSETTGLDGGGILLRRLRTPSPEGRTLNILIGVMSGEIVPDQSMMDAEEDAAGVLHLSAPECVRHLKTDGSTVSQIMELPIWGWGAEQWGLHSTLRADVAADCHRLDAIRNGVTDEAPGERERLERGYAGSILATGSRDDIYQRYRRLMFERYGHQPYAEMLTAGEINALACRSREIVKAIRPGW